MHGSGIGNGTMPGPFQAENFLKDIRNGQPLLEGMNLKKEAISWQTIFYLEENFSSGEVE
jgi:hypothetical protein